MAETSPVKSWYDAGLRLLNEPESPTLSPVESWFEEGLAVVERRNQMAIALAQKRKAMLLKREGADTIARREESAAKTAEMAATKKAEPRSPEAEVDITQLPPAPPTPLPSPAPLATLETSALLGKLLLTVAKVAEKTTAVIDARLAEAPLPARIAELDRVEKLKFAVRGYALAAAQLAYEDATAKLEEMWTPETQENAQRIATELFAVSKGLAVAGMETAKELAEKFTEQAKAATVEESQRTAAAEESDRVKRPSVDSLSPPVAPAPAPATAAPKMADIIDTAVGAGAFKTLAAALGAAGLVDTMKSAGPFTVFAPTDAAFAKLPAGTVEELIKPENKAMLAAILTYHVVSGKVMASTVVTMDGAKVPTVNGAEITINVGTDGVMVDGAKVTTTDIECSNGVIHIIDSVILPAAVPAKEKEEAFSFMAPPPGLECNHDDECVLPELEDEETSAVADEGDSMAEGLAVVERRNQMAASLAQKRKVMLLKREGAATIARREKIEAEEQKRKVMLLKREGAATIARREKIGAEEQKRKVMLLKREGAATIARREKIGAEATQQAATKDATVAAEAAKAAAAAEVERIAAKAAAAAEAERIAADQAKANKADKQAKAAKEQAKADKADKQTKAIKEQAKADQAKEKAKQEKQQAKAVKEEARKSTDAEESARRVNQALAEQRKLEEEASPSKLKEEASPLAADGSASDEAKHKTAEQAEVERLAAKAATAAEAAAVAEAAATAEAAGAAEKAAAAEAAVAERRLKLDYIRAQLSISDTLPVKEVVQQANAMVGLPNKGTLSTQVEALFEAVAVPDLKRLAAEKAQAEREQAEKAKAVKGAAVIMPGDIQPGFSGGW